MNKEIFKKPSFWITLVIIIIFLYFGYKAYIYYSCKSEEGDVCSNSSSRTAIGGNQPVIGGEKVSRVKCSFFGGKVCEERTAAQEAELVTSGRG